MMGILKQNDVSSQIKKIESEFKSPTIWVNEFSVYYLHQGCDIERELLIQLELIEELKTFSRSPTYRINGNENPHYIHAKTRKRLTQYDNEKMY